MGDRIKKTNHDVIKKIMDKYPEAPQEPTKSEMINNFVECAEKAMQKKEIRRCDLARFIGEEAIQVDRDLDISRTRRLQYGDAVIIALVCADNEEAALQMMSDSGNPVNLYKPGIDVIVFELFRELCNPEISVAERVDTAEGLLNKMGADMYSMIWPNS